MPSHKLQKKQAQQQRVLKKNFKDDLLKWICEKHATNSPLDRKLLRQKALQLSQSLEIINFKCSEQWMTTFLKRYGFSPTLTSCAGPYFKDYRLWIDLMRPTLTQYKYKDIFNVDELTMYSDVCLLQINANPQENQDFINNATNLISILLCCNSSGTDKLPPLITGPYKCTIARDDCKYYYNENSYINDEIFIEWIIYLNRLMSESSRRILLLLHRHRIRALGNTQLSNVKLIFFPTNFPPHLRPLRRDVFHSTKMNYRMTYAEKNVRGDSKWELNEMIMTVLKSWNDVPRELIVSSFQRATIRADDRLLEINNDDWEKLNTGVNFKKLVTFDDHLSDALNPTPTNDAKQINREKHNYNLRTSNHEVLQVDEVDDLSGLKNESLKTEGPIAKEIQTDTNSQRDVGSMTMDIDRIDSNHLEENVTKDLENFPREFADSYQNLENVPQNLEANHSKDTVEILSKSSDNIAKNLNENLLESHSSKDLEANFSEHFLANMTIGSQPNVSKSLSANVERDFEQKVAKDSEESICTDSQETISKNSEKKISNDLEKKISNDLEKNIPKDLEEKVSENLEKNISNDLDENISKNLEENTSKNLEQVSKNPEEDDSGRELSGIINKANKTAIALFMGGAKNFLAEMKTPSISLCGNSDDKNYCQQSGEDSVIDINDDGNKPSTSQKRNRPSLDDKDEPPEKIQTTETHWCDRYRNQYVFGPNSQVLPGPSTSSQNDDKNFEIGTQTSFSLLRNFDFANFNETEETKESSSGQGFIYTKSGKKNFKPRSPKE